MPDSAYTGALSLQLASYDASLIFFLEQFLNQNFGKVVSFTSSVEVTLVHNMYGAISGYTNPLFTSTKELIKLQTGVEKVHFSN